MRVGGGHLGLSILPPLDCKSAPLQARVSGLRQVQGVESLLRRGPLGATTVLDSLGRPLGLRIGASVLDSPPS